MLLSYLVTVTLSMRLLCDVTRILGFLVILPIQTASLFKKPWVNKWQSGDNDSTPKEEKFSPPLGFEL